MAFQDNWDSIKNPENVGSSTVTPLVLIDETPLAGGAVTETKIIVTAQDYNVYMTGVFNLATIAFEWSLTNTPSSWVRFNKVFDGVPMIFAGVGVELIPRISSGVYIRAMNTSISNASGDITIVLQ